jgi:hypothetical protein
MKKKENNKQTKDQAIQFPKNIKIKTFEIKIVIL